MNEEQGQKWHWYPCPCCDKEFAYSEPRLQHVIEVHLRPQEKCYAASVWCWCGTWFAANATTAFQAHCDRHGGIREHYTACLLGID